MWTGDTLGNLLEQWFLDFDELRRFDHIQNLLDLTQEHHLVRKIRIHTVLLQVQLYRQIQIQTETVNVDQYLLLRARLGPELQQSLDHLGIKRAINELHLNYQTEMR